MSIPSLSGWWNVWSPGGFTFEPLDPSDPKSLGFGVFSLQAPDPPDPSPSAAAEITAPIFRIESDGPLHISDPIFDPTTNISNLADAALISKQDIAVHSAALQQIAQTISPTTAAQTVTLVLSATSIAKLTQGIDYWIKTPTANLRMRLQTIDKTNNTATFAAAPGVTVPNIPAGALIFDQDPSLHGQLVFHNTNLNAGQGVSLFSANKIRFENSSQIQAFTDVVMQGGVQPISNSYKIRWLRLPMVKYFWISFVISRSTALNSWRLSSRPA